jgi:drug/metabolite transporter (DMT)-like permease
MPGLRYPAVEVVPITFAIPNFMPMLLAVLVLHESWGRAALAGAPFALGGLLLLLGTAAVARANPAAQLMRNAAG